MSPNLNRVISDTARRHMAERQLEALPWAPRASVGLSKLVIFGLTPVCVLAYIATRLGL